MKIKNFLCDTNKCFGHPYRKHDGSEDDGKYTKSVDEVRLNISDNEEVRPADHDFAT